MPAHEAFGYADAVSVVGLATGSGSTHPDPRVAWREYHGRCEGRERLWNRGPWYRADAVVCARFHAYYDSPMTRRTNQDILADRSRFKKVGDPVRFNTCNTTIE